MIVEQEVDPARRLFATGSGTGLFLPQRSTTILAALADGRGVGVTAPSHSAIQNLLCEVEKRAHEQGQTFTLSQLLLYHRRETLLGECADRAVLDGLCG